MTRSLHQIYILTINFISINNVIGYLLRGQNDYLLGVSINPDYLAHIEE